jgi:hypothetical protein
MNWFKWKLMSSYDKLLYQMTVCRKNKQRFHMQNGMILDFEKNIITYEDVDDIDEI